MTQMPSGQVVEVKPQASIYTVLLLVTIVILMVTIAVLMRKLLAQPPVGYGLEFSDLFKPFKVLGT